MRKKMFAAVLVTVLTVAFCLAGCSKTETSPAWEPGEASTEEMIAGDIDDTSDTPVSPGAAYGYSGDDPVELAVYKYMAEEKSKDYEKADASIPIVQIFHVDYTNEDEVLVYGDFWINNYHIEGDTLKCVSGGNYPGVMHLTKDGDSYVVSKMDVPEDGEGFDASAKKIFGEHYDDFMKVYSDDKAREDLRRITVSDYVNLNGLSVTKYQDTGWDPVELYLN